MQWLMVKHYYLCSQNPVKLGFDTLICVSLHLLRSTECKESVSTGVCGRSSVKGKEVQLVGSCGTSRSIGDFIESLSQSSAPKIL